MCKHKVVILRHQSILIQISSIQLIVENNKKKNIYKPKQRIKQVKSNERREKQKEKKSMPEFFYVVSA